MKVVLISPPSRIMNHYRPPLALMYLSGYLKHNNIDCKIIDIVFKGQIRDKGFYKNKDNYLLEVEDEILSRIKALDTDIVGITCYTPELLEAERLASRIKDIKKNITVVAGGIHPTLYPNDFLSKNSPFDFAVIGEGEVTLLELVKAIRSGKTGHNNVRGIGYFDKNNSEAVITMPRPLAQDLDGISYPDYEDLDMDFYTTPSPYAIRGVLTKSFYILSSRGCPSSCTFCVSKKLREHYSDQKFVRLRSPKSLFNEIKELRDKYKIDSFYFIDDLFTLKKDNVYGFCDLMVKARLPLIWACSSKVNTVDYDMLKRMRDAGCIQIDFGVEKGSDEALKYLKKGITVQKIRETFSYCHGLGIRAFANLLVNTPGETENDLRDILDLVKEIKPTVASFNIFAPYPGCEIYDSFCGNLKKEDYPLLMNSALWISKLPEKFKFSLHSVDILRWVDKANKKYNRILPNFLVHLKPVYLKNFLHSKRKLDYFMQLNSLLKEFINQKFISIKPQEKGPSCRLCSGNKTKLLFFAQDILGRYPLSQDKFGIYKCQDCSVAFTDIKISDEYYDKYYLKNFYEHTLNNAFLLKILGLIGNYGYKNKLRWIANFGPNGKRILEIGCGKGNFLHWLPSYFKKSGIEINKIASTYITEHYKDIEVYDEQIDSRIFDANMQFDIIIMWHTLEHVVNPLNLIKKCYGMLAKDGVLIFDLPNQNGLGFKLTKNHWFHLNAPRHLFYYNYTSIRWLLERHNFEIIKYGSNRIDYFQDLSVSFYEKFKTKIYLVNILIAALIAPAALILRLFTALFYPSISEVNFYVARKNNKIC